MVEQLNTIARLWWDWSVAMFWQVGLLILVIAVIDRLIRRWAWPQLRYALWSLILIKLLLPPSLSLPSGIVPGLVPVVKQALVRLESEKPVAAESGTLLSLNEDMLRIPARESARTTLPAAVTLEWRPESAGDGAPQEPSILIAWQVYAMMASLGGTLILGIWLFLRLHSLVGRRAQETAAASLPESFYNQLAGCAKRLELRCVPRVVVTRRLATPAVFGVFRPVLLMPRGYLRKLSRRDTEHMLLHELAHIKRGDLIAHGLYMLLQMVYWYNPLLWLVRRQMHHLRELSCDATVAELLREQTTAYRQTLLETARRLLTSSVEPGLGLLGLFEDSNRLLVRLNWLTKPTWRYRTMKRVTVATIAALMLACVLPMARAQEAASHDQSPEVVRQDDQRAQEIAALQARLEELMAQQQDLRKQLDTLRQRPQQSGPSYVESKRDVTKRRSREPFNMHVVKKGDTLASIAEKFYGREQGSRPENIDRIAQENNLDDSGRLWTGQSLRIPVRWMMTEDGIADPTHEQGDVMIVPWQDRESTEEELRTRRDAQKQAERARQEQDRAMTEVKKAQQEIEKARQEAERAAVEGERAQVQADRHKELQQQQQQKWANQMSEWAHSDQMQRWSADLEKWENSEAMNRWKQEVEKWGEQLARRHQPRDGNASDESADEPPAAEMAPMPAMPPMPPMPATPPMGEVSADVAPAMPHVESVPGVAAMPAPVPHPVPHANVVTPPVKVPPVAVPAMPAVPAAPKREKDPGQIVSCGEYLVESLPAGAVVKVENNIGSIRIEGAEDRSCTVKASAEFHGVDREEAERIAKDIKIQILPAGDQVRVSVQLPEGVNDKNGKGVQVNLQIAVPNEAKVQAVQKVGDVSLSSLRGEVKASVDVGAIRAMNLQGSAILQTNVGNIDFATSRDLSAAVRAQAKIGGISSNLPLEITRAAVTQSGDVQHALGSQAKGTFGSGQNKIDLSANVGSIQIRWAPAPAKPQVF